MSKQVWSSVSKLCSDPMLHETQDKKRVGVMHNCNQVQQSSPKQQQLGHDVDATLLASGSAERSGIRSLLLSTLSSLSSMEAHATNTTWAILDFTLRVWARCRSGTGSRSAQKQTHWQAGKAWEECKEWSKCQSSTSRAPQVAKPCQKIKGLLKKSRVKPNAE